MEKTAEENILKAIVIHGFKMERDFKTVDVSLLKNFLNTLDFTCTDDSQDYIVHNYRSPGYKQDILTLVLFNQKGTIIKVRYPEREVIYS